MGGPRNAVKAAMSAATKIAKAASLPDWWQPAMFAQQASADRRPVPRGGGAIPTAPAPWGAMSAAAGRQWGAAAKGQERGRRRRRRGQAQPAATEGAASAPERRSRGRRRSATMPVWGSEGGARSGRPDRRSVSMSEMGGAHASGTGLKRATAEKQREPKQPASGQVSASAKQREPKRPARAEVTQPRLRTGSAGSMPEWGKPDFGAPAGRKSDSMPEWGKDKRGGMPEWGDALAGKFRGSGATRSPPAAAGVSAWTGDSQKERLAVWGSPLSDLPIMRADSRHAEHSTTSAGDALLPRHLGGPANRRQSPLTRDLYTRGVVFPQYCALTALPAGMAGDVIARVREAVRDPSADDGALKSLSNRAATTILRATADTGDEVLATILGTLAAVADPGTFDAPECPEKAAVDRLPELLAGRWERLPMVGVSAAAACAAASARFHERTFDGAADEAMRRAREGELHRRGHWQSVVLLVGALARAEHRCPELYCALGPRLAAAVGHLPPSFLTILLRAYTAAGETCTELFTAIAERHTDLIREGAQVSGLTSALANAGHRHTAGHGSPKYSRMNPGVLAAVLPQTKAAMMRGERPRV
eukprot:TRINITY_DN7247_c0_g1_i1.p1 TRINITY_DN7247_c0_g1~~TRINITY_DN7247_c0_g1_i1.p1  ORF type:complete len:625 (+),score=135.34 TRINITY_DN7247_c0_g1_i1:101-1876(+)